MKRFRYGGAFAAILIFALMAFVLISSSVRQNRMVRARFSTLFQAIQQDKEIVVQEHYNMQTLDREYLRVLLYYDLVGWKFTKIGGQPWPLDQGPVYIDVQATLYYDLPDQLAQAREYKKIVHSRYGPCVEVPVHLQFHYDNTLEYWNLLPPDAKTNVNWLAPVTTLKELMDSMEDTSPDAAASTPPAE